MQTYVLGPNAARKLKGLFAGQGKVSSRKMSSPGVAFDSEYVAPFTVQWAQSVGESGSWIIWLPSDELLVVDGNAVDVAADLKEAGGDYPDGWYKLDFPDPESGGKVYLNIHVPKEDDQESDDGSAVNPEQTSEPSEGPTVEFAEEKQEPEEGETIIPILIAECSGEKLVKQIATSVISIGGKGGAVAVDKVSIDKLGGEDKNALELAHFADGEKDSGKGLETRLKADPETGEISGVDDDGLMLVARKDGQLIYVPIKGKGEDPEPPEDLKNGCDDHPGGGEGVSKDDDSSRFVPASGGVPKGGVSKGGGSVANCCS